MPTYIDLPEGGRVLDKYVNRYTPQDIRRRRYAMLRELGLSVSEAARVRDWRDPSGIYIDFNGELHNISELIPDWLQSEVRDRLKSAILCESV